VSEHIHLFVLCPPASGSTLLWRILQTSPTVSALPGEGQAVAPDLLFTEDRWDPRKVVDWCRVEERWRAHWNLDRTILLEKSPPHLIRAPQLEAHFPESRFVVMIRNPYAFCEGVRRRWGRRYTWRNLALFWVTVARYQVENARTLRRTLTLTYEELVTDPTGTCGRLVTFLPELGQLEPSARHDVFERSAPVTDLNREQIARLSPWAIATISEALGPHRNLLDHFGYELLTPSRPVFIRGLRRGLERIRSLWNRPGPLRWTTPPQL
jgi:hypothetical protein